MRASFYASGLAVMLAVTTSATLGCSRKKSSPGGGLPPASDWAGGGADLPPPPSVGPGAIAGAQGSGDPHAGLDISGGLPPGADPHPGGAGGGGGVDVGQLGLPAPDPSRPIDPSKFLRGSIHPGDATKAAIPAGSVIFINVKRAGADGEATGAPIAVEKLTASGWPLAFDVGEAQAMIGGTAFAGDVVITARADQDGDAISKQPGDVTGHVRATIPADKLEIVLDTVLP